MTVPPEGSTVAWVVLAARGGRGHNTGVGDAFGGDGGIGGDGNGALGAAGGNGGTGGAGGNGG
ncbi:hypothetical protein TMBG_02773, partial [Mycobacterium tuberculosis SUMu002]